ncbi:MAG: hypothetical protein PHS92_00005 [Candidatus Gracilibacteria bacterium]|nr:hypothetical protein [Candidatus Gracilibacteria bacterium]
MKDINKASDNLRGEILASTIPGKLLKEEEKEINEFTKQMWQELFPETSVSKFVKKNSNKTELEDYQKILIAPGEGIEIALRGLASIINPETYKEFGSALTTINQIDKNDMRDMTRFLKQSFIELSNTDKVHHALVLLASILFIFGGYSKISSMINGFKGSARVKNIMQSMITLKNAHYTSNGATMLPIFAVSGMHLRYINEIK